MNYKVLMDYISVKPYEGKYGDMQMENIGTL